MLKASLRCMLQSSSVTFSPRVAQKQLCSSATTLFRRPVAQHTKLVDAFSCAAQSLSRSPLTLLSRHGSSVARRSAWQVASRGTSWRQPKRQMKHKNASASSKKPISKEQSSKSKQKRTASQRPKKSQKAVAASVLKSRRRRRLPPRLSPYQRQTEKYNKRVVAIARLWKEQRQGVQKKKKSLASRLA